MPLRLSEMTQLGGTRYQDPSTKDVYDLVDFNPQTLKPRFRRVPVDKTGAEFSPLERFKGGFVGLGAEDQARFYEEQRGPGNVRIGQTGNVELFEGGQWRQADPEGFDIGDIPDIAGVVAPYAAAAALTPGGVAAAAGGGALRTLGVLAAREGAIGAGGAAIKNIVAETAGWQDRTPTEIARDIGTEAAIGAVAGPAIIGGARALGAAGRGVGNVALEGVGRLSGVPKENIKKVFGKGGQAIIDKIENPANISAASERIRIAADEAAAAVNERFGAGEAQIYGSEKFRQAMNIPVRPTAASDTLNRVLSGAERIGELGGDNFTAKELQRLGEVIGPALSQVTNLRQMRSLKRLLNLEGFKGESTAYKTILKKMANDVSNDFYKVADEFGLGQEFRAIDSEWSRHVKDMDLIDRLLKEGSTEQFIRDFEKKPTEVHEALRRVFSDRPEVIDDALTTLAAEAFITPAKGAGGNLINAGVLSALIGFPQTAVKAGALYGLTRPRSLKAMAKGVQAVRKLKPVGKAAKLAVRPSGGELDDFAEKHLEEWVRGAYRPEQVDTVLKGMRKFISKNPEYKERPWPEIRNLAEREGFLEKKQVPAFQDEPETMRLIQQEAPRPQDRRSDFQIADERGQPRMGMEPEAAPLEAGAPTNVARGSKSAINPGDPEWSRTVGPVETEIRLGEADDLVTSHTSKWAKREDYPQQYQQRSEEGRQRELDRRKGGFVARQLVTDDPLGGGGLPVIIDGKFALAGNGRLIMLDQLESAGSVKYAEYLDEVRKEMVRYGLDPAELSKYRRPRLYRAITKPLTEEQKVRLSRLLNKNPYEGAALSENAARMAAAVSDDVVAKLRPFERTKEIFDSGGNQDILSQIASESENVKQAWSGGRITPTGEKEITEMFYQKVFPGEAGERLFNKLKVRSEAGDNIIGALDDAVGPLAIAEALIRTGRRSPGLTVGDDLADAILKNLEYRDSKAWAGKPWAEFKGQGQLVDAISDDAWKIADYINANYAKRKEIDRFFRGYAKEVIDSPVLTEKGAMFADEVADTRVGKTKSEILDELGVVGKGKAPAIAPVKEATPEPVAPKIEPEVEGRSDLPPSARKDPKIAELFAKTEKRKAWAKENEGRPFSVKWNDGSGRSAIISKDIQEPDKWRMTYIDADGTPSGHMVHPTYWDAVREIGSVADLDNAKFSDTAVLKPKPEPKPEAPKSEKKITPKPVKKLAKAKKSEEPAESGAEKVFPKAGGLVPPKSMKGKKLTDPELTFRAFQGGPPDKLPEGFKTGKAIWSGPREDMDVTVKRYLGVDEKTGRHYVEVDESNMPVPFDEIAPSGAGEARAALPSPAPDVIPAGGGWLKASTDENLAYRMGKEIAEEAREAIRHDAEVLLESGSGAIGFIDNAVKKAISEAAEKAALEEKAFLRKLAEQAAESRRKAAEALKLKKIQDAKDAPINFITESNLRLQLGILAKQYPKYKLKVKKGLKYEFDGKKREVAMLWSEDNTIYVNPNKIRNADDLRRRLAHEVIGHGGIRRVLGDKLVLTLDKVIRDNSAPIAAKMKSLGLSDTLANRRFAAEEVLADAAAGNRAELIGFDKFKARVISLFKQDYDIKLTDADAQLLIESARKIDDTVVSAGGPKGSGAVAAATYKGEDNDD